MCTDGYRRETLKTGLITMAWKKPSSLVHMKNDLSAYFSLSSYTYISKSLTKHNNSGVF